MMRVLAAATAVLVLAGCVTIPDSGPVTEGYVDAGEQTGDLVFLAQEPQQGATQEEIVRGFLSAAISPGDDFAIAREYLAGEAAQQWDPGAGVLVRAGQPEVSLSGETTATAVTAAVSEVDASGALRLLDVDRMLEFRLLQVAGEWRISQAPDGIVLSSFHFAQLFRPHTLHWLTLGGGRTVPEVRWFERTATTLSRRVVEALLAGPSSWLAPAVATAAASGVRLVGEPVVAGTIMTVTIGIAQVEQLGSSSLEPLAAQLALSLRSTGVREVRIQVEGLDGFTASSASAPPLDDGDVDQRPLVLDGSSLRALGGGAAAIEDVGPALSAIGATDYTIGDDGGVAMTGSTAAWLEPGAAPVVISTGATAVPTVDDTGWVLLQEQSAPQSLLAWHDGERRALSLPPSSVARLAAMELSRDGARLAVTVVDGDESEVWVAAVVRDERGMPISLGEPYRLPRVDGVAADITWVSSTELAVLAGDEGESQIVLLAVGGAAEQLPTPGEPVRAIVGGSEGASTLWALDVDGSLLSLRGRVWAAASGLAPVALIATQQ